MIAGKAGVGLGRGTGMLAALVAGTGVAFIGPFHWPLRQPFTHTTCFKVCTTSTSASWARITASMSL